MTHREDTGSEPDDAAPGVGSGPDGDRPSAPSPGSPVSHTASQGSGRLHPRLAATEARRRLDAYSGLPFADLRARASAEDPQATFAAVGAPRLTSAEARALQSQLRGAAESNGWPEPPSGPSSAAFDGAAAGILLEHGRLFPAEAAAAEIWSFHALVLAPDVAFWRFRERGGQGINPERLIGSDLTRHVFGRLWWRGYMLCARSDGSADLANLSLLHVLGEADFDQIQARRRAFGASPAVFQSIVWLWRALDAEGLLIEAAFPRRELLRDMLARLLRLGAFQRFDLLSEKELNSEVLRAFEESLLALSEGEGGDPTGGGDTGRVGRLRRAMQRVPRR